MANAVNGASAMTEALRERSGVYSNCFKQVHPKGIMRARVALDIAAEFEIDDVTIENTFEFAANQKIFVVGLQFQPNAAALINFYSKVGSATSVQIAEYNQAAKDQVTIPIKSGQVIFETAVGAGLTVNASSACDILVYYVFATECHI